MLNEPASLGCPAQVNLQDLQEKACFSCVGSCVGPELQQRCLPANAAKTDYGSTAQIGHSGPVPLVLPPEHVVEAILDKAIRSDNNSTGFRGVRPHRGRYEAGCTLAACHKNHLGTFDTAEEAAQAYLEHQQKEHPKELET